MNNRFLHMILSIVLLLGISSCGSKNAKTEEKNYKIVDGTIVFDEPQRKDGQKACCSLPSTRLKTCASAS